MALVLKYSPELKAILARKPPKNARLKILLIKERHLKRLEELSEKSAKQVPQLEDPTYEQKKWVNFRLSHSNTWPKVKENKIGDWKNWSRRSE